MSILHPALIIGLGGSGISIARRFRRRLLEEFPKTPYVRVLGIDTDQQEQVTADAPALADDSFMWTARFDPQNYVGPHAIDQNAEIRSWWSGYDSLPLKFVTAGAQQRRPVGRLAFFVHYEAIRQLLQRTISSIYNSENYFELPPQYQHGLNIYIVASTCGGTGTGMFLDMATVVRHVAKQVQPAKPASVRGLLLLPSAFIGTGRVPQNVTEALRANAHGALTELDFGMALRHERPPVAYPGGDVFTRDKSTFDMCYLVGNQSLGGAVFTNFDEILERSATQMMVELASPLEAVGESRLDNYMSAMRSDGDYRGRPRLYSSFAADWLELPSKRVHKRWAKHFAKHVLDRWARPFGQGGESVVRSIMDELQRAPAFGHLQRMMDRDGVNPFIPDVSSEEETFRDLPPAGQDPQVLIQRAGALEGAYRRSASSINSALVGVQDSLREVQQELAGAAGAALASGSIQDARRTLDKIRVDLGSWIKSASDDRGRTATSEWIAEFSRKVSAVKPSLLEKFTSDKDNYLREQQDLIEDAIQAARAAAVNEARARLARLVLDDGGLIAADRHAVHLLGIIEQANAVRESAAGLVAQIVEPKLPAGMDAGLVTDELVDAEFDSGDRLTTFEASAKGQISKLLLDASNFSTGDALCTAMFSIADRVVAEAKDAFLRSVPPSPEVIGERVNRMEPFILFSEQWSASRGSRKSSYMHLVGGPQSMLDKKKAILEQVDPARRNDVDFVPLEDPDQVIMTCQLHGFPLFAITELERCRAAFIATSAHERALRFAQPDVLQSGWDLQPLNEEEGGRLFAVGLALGTIRRSGQGYLFVSTTGATTALGAEDGDRDAARRGARAAFIDSFAVTLQLALTDRLKREGNDVVSAALRTWLDAEEVRQAEEGYPGEFRSDLDRVRRYYKSII